jgi:hypothetical protein
MVNIDFMGHFHQFFDGGNFVVNGSLIGYSPFGIAVKGAFEPPAQSLLLINGKHLRKTMVTPIFLDDK